MAPRDPCLHLQNIPSVYGLPEGTQWGLLMEASASTEAWQKLRANASIKKAIHCAAAGQM